MVLRDTLSGTATEQINFLEDMELWEWCEQVQHLEAIQMLIVGVELQVHLATYIIIVVLATKCKDLNLHIKVFNTLVYGGSVLCMSHQIWSHQI